MTSYRAFILSVRCLDEDHHECQIEGRYLGRRSRSRVCTIGATRDEAEARARAIVDGWYAVAASGMWGELLESGVVTREG